MKTETNVNQTPVAVHTSSDAQIETDYTTNQAMPGTAVQQAQEASGTNQDMDRRSHQEAVEASNAVKTVLKQNENDSKKTEESAATADAVKEALSMVQENMGPMQRDFDFAVDDDSGHMVVTIMDRSTKEVLRQIPSEDFLAMARNIELSKGNFFEGEA